MRYPLLAFAALALSSCGSSGGADDPADTAAFPSQPAQPDLPPQGRYAPRNDCIELPGAKPFFVALEQAVRNRNADELLAITDRGVRLDFGGAGGLTTFRERLEASDSQLWTELDRILALGCAVNGSGAMVLPSYFAQDLPVDDPFAAMLVTGADIPVFGEPDRAAKPVATVSWDTVTALDDRPRGEFTHVRTQDGEEGYVAATDLRRLVGYRLLASKAGDSWRISAFVSGD